MGNELQYGVEAVADETAHILEEHFLIAGDRWHFDARGGAISVIAPNGQRFLLTVTEVKQ